MHNLASGTEVICKSSMDETKPFEGRPFGGCAIIYKPNIKFKLSEITCKHNRLCALSMDLSEKCNVLFLNAYMPCDSNSQDEHFASYMDVLSEVEQIIQCLDPTHVIFGGDLNTDLSRSSPHSIALNDCINDLNMVTCIYLELAEVPYTFIGPKSTSRIGNFLVSSAIGNSVVACDIIDNYLFSDHVPVKLVLDLCVEHFGIKDRPHCSKTAWWKASEPQLAQYKQNLQTNLESISFNNEFLYCKDINCKEHLNDLNILYNDVLNACIVSSLKNCLTKTCLL